MGKYLPHSIFFGLQLVPIIIIDHSALACTPYFQTFIRDCTGWCKCGTSPDREKAFDDVVLLDRLMAQLGKLGRDVKKPVYIKTATKWIEEEADPREKAHRPSIRKHSVMPQTSSEGAGLCDFTESLRVLRYRKTKYETPTDVRDYTTQRTECRYINVIDESSLCYMPTLSAHKSVLRLSPLHLQITPLLDAALEPATPTPDRPIASLRAFD
ncbi:hypothetical protein EVAR_57991_1 [Eumeta japonica]|uniref:Uncharacterized protein n=1 Tax=Eumeta variegata TaxID=151549 RepID=A0A4C1YCY8_EUMVA|nr:hypothetical protein EVAR_57991_1 [Eumeta japonica]